MNIKSFFTLRHLHFYLCAGLFLLLLARNPFSDRTLIPNFEPYPDSLHYIVPARSLLSGQGPYLTREGRHLMPSVPMLYSLSLLPFFALYNDPRMAYVANVLLAFVSLGLLYLILQKIKIARSIQFLVLFLYVSNYYTYWYPTLVMAENLTSVLFLLGVFLLVIRTTPKRAGLAGMIAVGFYATKYANIPLTVAFGLLYAVKIAFPLSTLRERLSTFLTFIVAGVLSFGLFVSWEFFFYGKNVFSAVIGVFGLKSAETIAVPKLQAQAGTGFFSVSYVPNNLRFYFQMLLGKSTKMLWVFTPLVPIFFAVPGLAGLIATLADTKRRLLSASLLLLIFANIAFLSTFYSPDARYFIYIIPSLLLGLALLLQSIHTVLSRNHKIILFGGIIGLLIFVSFVMGAKRIKNQVALNLRHAETPWYYLSVKELNIAVDDFIAKNHPTQPLIVISALPPYFVDFYSNGKYTLLPLDPQQEFRGTKDVVFGNHDYSDLHALYRSEIKQGKSILVEKYGLGNEINLQNAFANLSSDFNLELLRSGCHDLCNVYLLTEKTSPDFMKAPYETK